MTDQTSDQQQKSESKNKDALSAFSDNSPVLNYSITALSVVLPAIVARSGWSNLIFVPVCSAVLLLNPWVRTFLELKPVDDDKEDDKDENSKGDNYSTFDPARIVRQLKGSGIVEKDTSKKKEASSNDVAKNTSEKGPLDRSDAYAALRRMPASLRRPLSDLEELIIRDCIVSWYNYHSFGDSSLPNETRYSIDHTIGSIFNAMEHTRSADIMAELSLAAASVLLVTLRYRRLHPNRAPIFANDKVRIQALREALDRVFVRHARREDGQCDILRTLLREIICKQIWNAICGIGEPDFINQQIVAWDERNRGNEDGSQRKESYPPNNEPGYVARDGAKVVPLPSLAKASSPMQFNEFDSPQTYRKAVPARSSPIPTPSATSASIPSSSNRNTNEQVPKTPTLSQRPTQKSSHAEPLTVQPRAMTMPSPLVKSGASMAQMQARAMQPSVSPSKEKGDMMSNASSPPKNGNHSSRISEEDFSAWDNVMRMDLPHNAQEGMTLPDSIRDSMSNIKTEGYEIPNTPEKRKVELEPVRVPTNTNTVPAEAGENLQSPLFSPTLSEIRPPSRATSAASGGIPPAPELYDVLTSKPDSPGFSPLRDAFENFLERGGVANRNLFFSPPSAAVVAPGEGEALLKLHVGLSAMARLVPSDSDEQNDDIFREDALGILHKAYLTLSDVDDGPAGRPLRESLATSIHQLQDREDITLRQILTPVEMSLWNRLTGLFEYFWKETCTKPGGSNLTGNNTPSRSSFASEQRPNIKRFSREVQSSDRSLNSSSDLAYEPRKKQTSSAIHSPSKPFVHLPSETRNPPRPASSPPRPSTSMQAPPVPPRKENLRRSTVAPEPPTRSGLEITVTDVSPNAERPTLTADLRTFEVMIAVEGLMSDSGGFVLLRHWRDFQQLREELSQSTSLPPLPVALPIGKGKSSGTLTREIQIFLQVLLTSPDHMTSGAVQYFVDKARAGEPGSENTDRIGVLMDSLQLSKGLNLGKNLASGMVNTIQRGTRQAVGMTQSLSQPGLPLSQSEDLVGPELAHLPIGARKSHVGGRAEEERNNGLGITHEDTQKRQSPIPGPSSKDEELQGPPRHRRTQSSDSATTHQIKPPPMPGRSPTSPSPIGGVSAGPNIEQGPAPDTISELSQADLDNLLSCMFAIADEAFNLSGGWTFRRGMLRVFEQIVRTQYWSSILGVFNNMVHALTYEQMGNWCTDAKVKFWPDEPITTASRPSTSPVQPINVEGFGDAVVEAALDATQHSTSPTSNAKPVPAPTNEPAEKRSVAQRAETHARAQSILLAHVPSSTAYLLGPGGRQSCERAVICVHEEITQPTTSLDLVLTVILKLCDIAAR